jgi:hypothetical protein
MRLRIFVFFLALFVATTAGHIYTIDSYLNYLVAKSIGGYGVLAVPKFMMTVEGAGGRHYSKLGIGQSLASLPFFWTGKIIEGLSPDNPAFRVYGEEFKFPDASGVITAVPQTLIRASDSEGAQIFLVTLTNAFVVAGLCLVFWLLLKSYGLSDRGAFWGTMLLALTTPLWIYSRDFFAEPLFAICLLGTFYLLRDRSGTLRQAALAGMVSSIGILTRASFIPLIAIFAVYLVMISPGGDTTSENSAPKSSMAASSRLRKTATYIAFCLPGLLALAILNTVRFGSPLLTGYHTAYDQGFSIPLIKGLVWNLASSHRSIFLYAPATLLMFLGLPSFAKKHRGPALLIGAVVVYVFVIYSKWWAWHGGWCWGPRFLVPVIPLMLLPGLVAVKRAGKWMLMTAAGLGVLGFVVQLSGALINYTATYDYWIKIGKVDFADVDAHLLSPVTAHLKAVFATSPVNYDLWIVQLFRMNQGVFAVVLAGLAVVMIFTLWPLGRTGQRRPR